LVNTGRVTYVAAVVVAVALVLGFTVQVALSQPPQLRPGMTPQLIQPKTTQPGKSITPIKQGPPPTNITVSATKTTATLAWPGVQGASGYRVYRRTAQGTVPLTPAPVASTSAMDKGLAPGTSYSWTVYAFYPDGRQGGSAPVSITTKPPVNPSGFTASVAGNDVVLRWNPVPEASFYWLQGSGLAAQKVPAATTTYTVRGIQPGSLGYSIIAYYESGGQAFADERNIVKASVTMAGSKAGWYAFYLTGFQVQQQTEDHALNVDGWGDEVFITMDVVETAPGGKKMGVSGRLPAVGNFGDRSRAENVIKAGTANPNGTGGLKNVDTYFGTPFPYRVWCGQLVEGQTNVVITSTIWEWDGTAGASFYDWMAWIKKHNTDLQQEDVVKAGAAMNANFGMYMQAGAVLTAAGAQGLLELKGVLGVAKDRPIGMAGDGSFAPRAVILTYDIAVKALSQAWFGDPAGTFSIAYREPSGWPLNGWYTLKGRIQPIQGPQVCQQ